MPTVWKGIVNVDSCIYQGHVRHRRFRPIAHAFSYRLFLMYLDLDELPTLFAQFSQPRLWSVEHSALAQFRRTDHMGAPHIPLAQAVRDLVEQRTQKRPQGSIRLLTHLRYFGYCFNPVSLYFCYDAADRQGKAQIQAIVAEVNNTPWGEQHCYVLHADNAVQQTRHSKIQRYHLAKAFHVSPFMGMDVEYDWRLSDPGQHLSIHIQNQQTGQAGQAGQADYASKTSRTFFDATLLLKRQEISRSALAQVLLRYPLMTLQVSAAIYYHALRLKWKKAPYYPHPSEKQTSVESAVP